MKQLTTFIFVILCLCCSQLKAQRFIGFNNVFVQGGYSTENALNADIGYEIFFGEAANKSVYASIGYSKRTGELKTSKYKVDLQDYTFSLGAKKYFNVSNAIYPYIGLGAVVGYEKLEPEEMPHTVLIEREKGMLYGVKSDIGAEYLFSSFSIYANICPRYEFNFKEFSTSFQLGVKCFF